jgi:hypothetical protein
VGHSTVLAVDNFVNIFLVFLKYLPYLYIIEIKRNMNIEEIYEVEQMEARFNAIMSFTEILNQEEYDFCFDWNHEETRISTSKIGEGRYLNLNVYSEADKEEYDLRMEQGL